MDWTERLKLRDLQILMRLARTLNISQTARDMNKNQPAISKWLRDLEFDIGLQLFHRTGKGLSPTVHGLALVQHAARVNAVLDVARDDMEVHSRQGSGLITIGIIGASSADALPTGVVQLLQTYPDIHVRLIENTLEILSTRLEEGGVDILIAQSDCEFDPTIVASEHLYDDSVCMVTRVGHPLDGAETVTWKEINSFPLILWAPETPMRQAFNRAVAKHGLPLPPTYIESNSTSITLNMLFNSDMVGLALLSPSRRYEALDLLSIIPMDFDEWGSISMYWNRGAANRKVVGRALDGIRQVSTTTVASAGDGVSVGIVDPSEFGRNLSPSRSSAARAD